MKKILIPLILALTLLLTFSGCAASETTKSESLNPLPAPEPPVYVPEPLNVEFFSFSNKGMSNWVKYPNTPATTETPDSESVPSEENAQ